MNKYVAWWVVSEKNRSANTQHYLVAYFRSLTIFVICFIHLTYYCSSLLVKWGRSYIVVGSQEFLAEMQAGKEATPFHLFCLYILFFIYLGCLLYYILVTITTRYVYYVNGSLLIVKRLVIQSTVSK